jgi:hypothetical protein
MEAMVEVASMKLHYIGVEEEQVLIIHVNTDPVTIPTTSQRRYLRIHIHAVTKLPLTAQ